MRSLVLAAPRRFSLIEEPRPELPGPGWVAVRLRRAMLCGTDLPYFNGHKPIAAFPMQPGRPIHECGGVVEESSSALFAPGQRVMAMPDADQGLREIYLAREEDVIRIPDEIEDWDLGTLIQPLSTVIFGVEKLGPVKGRGVLIVGAGPIGMLTLWLLLREGAGPATVLDPVQSRLDLAFSLGADAGLAMTTHQALAGLRGGSLELPQADIVVEAVGHQQDTLNHCVELGAKGGVILALGVPDHPVYALEFNRLFRKNMTLIGSVTPPWAEYLAKAADLVRDNQRALAPLITDVFPILQAEEAYGLAERRDSAGKVVLNAENWNG